MIATRALLVMSLLISCGNPTPQASQKSAPKKATGGEKVTPPFAVKGNAEGLLLVWFDEKGSHQASTRDEIPAAHRQAVRVDSLNIPPEKRLDPGFVYVADLRSPQKDGSYAVKKMTRDDLDALIETQEPQAKVASLSNSSEVIVYGASWCGACRSTAAFLRSKSVPFVEKNIEQDPAARTEMLNKAQAAGLQSTGIPVIDFRGKILQGFDPSTLESLIEAGKKTS